MRLSVNGIVRIWFKAEFETHIEMLEAMADYLEGLGFNLQVTIQYSDDLEDELSKIIAWDTTTPTTMTLQPTDANSRFTRARRLTSRRFDMGAYNESDEANRIAFPQFYNRNLYDDSNPIFDGIVNRYDELGRLYYSNISYQTFSESFLWANTLIPMIYLTDIVRTVFEHLKIEVTGEFFESDLVKKILVYNNRTLDYVQVSENGVETRRTGLRVHMGDAEPDQIIYRYENVHDFNIRLRNHVPDMSITEFLKGLKNWLNLRYDFNILQNKVEIRFVRSIYRAPEILDLSKHAGRVYEIEYGKENGIGFTYANPDPIMQDGNIGELPTPQYTVNNYMAMLVLDAEIDEICFVRSLKAYFRLTPNNEEEPSWKIRAFVQQDDDTEKRVAWECGAVPMVDGYFNNRKMPSIEMTAWQPEINLFNRETGLRLTAFYGAQPDSNDYPYAFASSTRYNAKELATPDQYDLDLRGPDIYPYWRYTESTLKGGKLLGCTLKLNESMLRRLSSTSKIRIVNIDYLIKENEVTNTFEEFALAKAKLYKIKI
ncbi:hypothetical protein [Mongoliibacter ruber]|uniref:hypothetical protein n=1 Tax=Mongoliibacter ruber TaxID=1750599 RepID=UPI0011B1D717|nr:hypothetical protein [Mongoliibacter ruber]